MKKKKLKYPINKETHEYMRMRKLQNVEQSKASSAESWMFQILKTQTSLKWTRQAQWGYRIFDFWNSKYGVAVEVDGKEHNKAYDEYRDRYNFDRSGIVVLRVRNFNEKEAVKAIETIKGLDTWLERRADMGLLTKAQKNKLL